MKYKWPILIGLSAVLLAMLIGVVVVHETVSPFKRGSYGEAALLCSIPGLIFALFTILSIMIGIFIHSKVKKSIGIYGACEFCGNDLEKVLKDSVPTLMCLKCGDSPPLDDLMRKALLNPWKYERDYIIKLDVRCVRCGSSYTVKGMRPMWIKCKTCGSTVIVPPPTPPVDIDTSNFRFR